MENHLSDQELTLAKVVLLDNQAAALKAVRDARPGTIADLADAMTQIHHQRRLLAKVKELFGADHPRYLEASDEAVSYFVTFAIRRTRLAGADHSRKVAEVARALGDFDMSEPMRKAYTERSMRFLDAMAKWQSKPFRGFVQLTSKKQ